MNSEKSGKVSSCGFRLDTLDIVFREPRWPVILDIIEFDLWSLTVEGCLCVGVFETTPVFACINLNIFTNT